MRQVKVEHHEELKPEVRQELWNEFGEWFAKEFSAPLQAAVSDGRITSAVAKHIQTADPKRAAELMIAGAEAEAQRYQSSSTRAPSRPGATRASRSAVPAGRVRVSSPETLEVNPTGPVRGSWLSRAFNPDGSINETFDREVKAGRWLGVDLAKS